MRRVRKKRTGFSYDYEYLCATNRKYCTIQRADTEWVAVTTNPYESDIIIDNHTYGPTVEFYERKNAVSKDFGPSVRRPSPRFCPEVVRFTSCAPRRPIIRPDMFNLNMNYARPASVMICMCTVRYAFHVCNPHNFFFFFQYVRILFL